MHDRQPRISGGGQRRFDLVERDLVRTGGKALSAIVFTKKTNLGNERPLAKSEVPNIDEHQSHAFWF